MKVEGTIAKSERVHVRRALSREEFARLISHTASAGLSFGMTGEDRAMLYRLACATGFRQGELRSLTCGSFQLGQEEGEDSIITVAAAYSKRKRDDHQPIASELAAVIEPWLATKPVTGLVFALPHSTKVADMLRTDAAAARAAWIAEAKGKLASERAKSTFLADEDASGGLLDFHALRHSYITWLVASGANVSVCQALARHSTPMLTLGVYSHPTLADQGKALASLPHAPLPNPESQTMKATGTDGDIQHRAGAVELVQKTPDLFGLRLACSGKSQAGVEIEDHHAENTAKQGKTSVKRPCPGWESNPHDPYGSQDFKS